MEPPSHLYTNTTHDLELAYSCCTAARAFASFRCIPTARPRVWSSWWWMRCWQRMRCEQGCGQCGQCGQGLKKVCIGCVTGAQESVEPMVVDALPAAGEVWDGVWTGCTWECRHCDPGRSAGSRRGLNMSVHWVWTKVWEGCEGECDVHLPHTCLTSAPFLHITNKTTNPVLSPILSLSVPAVHCPLTPHLPHTSPIPAQLLHPTDKVNGLYSPPGARAHSSCSPLATHLLHTSPTPPPHLPSSCTLPIKSTTLWSS